MNGLVMNAGKKCIIMGGGITVIVILCAVVFSRAKPTDVHDAIRRGDFAKAKRLLTQHSEWINAYDDRIHLRERVHDVVGFGIKKVPSPATRNSLRSLLIPNGGRPLRHLTPLHCVTMNWDDKGFEMAKWLLAHGANPNAKGELDEPPIYWLFDMKSSPQIVELLLQNGANPNATCNDELLLSCAAWIEDNRAVELLLQYGADAKSYNPSSSNPSALHAAAAKCDPQTVKLLIQYGANVNVVDSDGQTPLHYAWRLEIAELLLQNGADINAKDRYGWTPLMVGAALGGNKFTTAMLVSCHAEFDPKSILGAEILDRIRIGNTRPPGGGSINLSPPSRVREEIIKLLLGTLPPADIFLQKEFLDTAIAGNVEKLGAMLSVCPALIKSVDCRGYYPGSTALHHAAERGSIAAVEFLLSRGALPLGLDENCSSPLFLAIREKHREIIKMLLAKETDPKAALNRNFAETINFADPSIVEFLLQLGADPNAKDDKGRSALEILRRGKSDVTARKIKLLRQYGAKN